MATRASASGSLLGSNSALRGGVVTLVSVATIVWGKIVTRVVPTPEALDQARAAELLVKVGLRSVHNLLFLGVAMITLLVPEFPLTRWVGGFTAAVWILHSAALIDGVRRVAQMQRAHIRKLTRTIKMAEAEERRIREYEVDNWDARTWGMPERMERHPSFPPRNRVMRWDEEPR